MTIDQLTDFYALKSCDEQWQVDELIVKAFTFSLEGEAIIASEMLTEAHKIITDTLERDKQYRRTTKEMERFISNVDAVSVGNGGLYD